MQTEEQIKASISIHLVQFRNEHGLSQKQMAAMISMKRHNYARIETRKTRPSLSALTSIAKVTGKSIDELCAENAHS